MAITAATLTSDFSGFLDADRSGLIFEAAKKQSIVQSLARKVPLGIGGQEFPVVTSKVQAGWVSEAGTKPASAGGMSLKSMQPKKIAAIAVVSAEVVRANPGGYVDEIRPQIAEAFALAFDSAVLHGTSTPFGAYLDQTAKTRALGTGTASASYAPYYTDFVEGLRLLVAAGKRCTGFALDSRLEPDLLGALDTTGRPYYVPAPYEAVAPQVRGGNLIGRPSFMGDYVGDPTPGTSTVTYELAYAGDWDQIVWGQIGGISYDVSTQATVTINGVLTSLWEKNLVAVRAETEYGVLINDLTAFTKFTKVTP